jgi:uncharacterized membrane-anchored protein YhcB (DUF1043 family)
MSNYPAEFNDVIIQLESLSNLGSNIYGRVAELKANFKTSLNSLNDISSRTASIGELINKLKVYLAELERKNEELERMLEEGRMDFESKMSELQERQRRELDEERERLAAEKKELERIFAESAEMSQAERESAIREAAEAADKRAREQNEAIQRAHEEERAKLIDQYQKDYNGLLQALTRIASNQALAIGKINSELEASEQLTTEFANVQKQILGLLASISQILTDEQVQGSSPPQQEVSSILEESLPLPPQQIPPEYFAPNINESDTTNLNELKNSSENSKKFEYMLKILKQREQGFNDAQRDSYNWKVTYPFSSWKQMSNNSNATVQQLLDQKTLVYTNVNNLFNETASIPPETEQMKIQVGGRGTRRHRHGVYFKTLANKGRKGGKKGGRKSHKGGKKSGRKRTRKH